MDSEKIYGQCPYCNAALTADHIGKCTQTPVGLSDGGIDKQLYNRAHHVAVDIIAPWIAGKDPCKNCIDCNKVCHKMLGRATTAIYNILKCADGSTY